MPTYTCPMHPEIEQDSKGVCPICKMNLVEKGKTSSVKAPRHGLREYLPLITIAFCIILFTVLRQLYGGWNLMGGMSDFMAGFFLVFGGFKLVKLKGFAEAYRTYDIVARKSALYAYLYPFLELGLGLLYLFVLFPLFTNIATVLLMGVSSIGVWREVRKKSLITCACLGTVFKLPMTWVTLFEDLLMAVMALVMIVLLMLS